MPAWLVVIRVTEDRTFIGITESDIRTGRTPGAEVQGQYVIGRTLGAIGNPGHLLDEVGVLPLERSFSLLNCTAIRPLLQVKEPAILSDYAVNDIPEAPAMLKPDLVVTAL
jgi:hypothetical protein